MTAGYADGGYAASLAEWGRPRRLMHARGWLLDRPIGDSGAWDAMGPYPMFCCEDWHGLSDDLAALAGQVVSVVLVADPFGRHDLPLLERTFNAGVVAFKEHQVVDFGLDWRASIASHHRRNVKKASRTVRVERLADPSTHLDPWVALYATLCARHDVDGIRAFSRQSFERQLALPGIVAYAATIDGAVEGMLCFYVSDDVAYYHLGAFSDRGYEQGAAFALFSAALEDLSQTARWLTLGGDAGVGEEGGGLSRFKRGWANSTRIAYLCKHVVDADKYAALTRGRAGSFFPLYRQGEFAPRSAERREGRDD